MVFVLTETRGEFTYVRKKAHIRRFWPANRGSAALEFALGAPILVVMLSGIVETGMVMFTSTLLEGALRDASRYGITGQEADPNVRLQNIIDIIAERTIGLVDVSKAKISVEVYPGFGDVGKGEDFVDGNGNGTYDPGETYTDTNGNGQWDADMGTAGPGGAGDIVLYRIDYDWPLLTPIASTFMGNGGVIPLSASIVVRNEPWDEGGAGS